MKNRRISESILLLALSAFVQLAQASDIAENKDLVRRFVAATNELDFAVLDQIVAPDVVRHSQSTPDLVVTSVEDLKAFLAQDAATMEGANVEVHTMVAEGDRVAGVGNAGVLVVALYGTFSGKHVGNFGPIEATGKTVSANLHAMFRIEDKRIAEFWVLWDNVHVLTQLGHSPFRPADCD